MRGHHPSLPEGREILCVYYPNFAFWVDRYRAPLQRVRANHNRSLYGHFWHSGDIALRRFWSSDTSPANQSRVRIISKVSCSITGSAKKGGPEIGKPPPFLGILGPFPSEENGGVLSVRLTDGKAANWAGIIRHVINEGWVSPQCLEGLIGQLSSPQTSMFGKFARSQMRALYKIISKILRGFVI